MVGVYATGLFNMMRNFGIAVSGAIVNDRTNFHYLILASNLTDLARAAVPRI